MPCLSLLSFMKSSRLFCEKKVFNNISAIPFKHIDKPCYSKVLRLIDKPSYLELWLVVFLDIKSKAKSQSLCSTNYLYIPLITHICLIWLRNYFDNVMTRTFHTFQHLHSRDVTLKKYIMKNCGFQTRPQFTNP
jgi:hypothetical protein